MTKDRLSKQMAAIIEQIWAYNDESFKIMKLHSGGFVPFFELVVTRLADT